MRGFIICKYAFIRFVCFSTQSLKNKKIDQSTRKSNKSYAYSRPTYIVCSDMNLIVLMWQGTVAGVEIDMGHGRLYTTIVVPRDEAASYGARGSPGARVDDPGTYNPELFRLSLPQVPLSLLLPEHMPSFRSNR